MVWFCLLSLSLVYFYFRQVWFGLIQCTLVSFSCRLGPIRFDLFTLVWLSFNYGCSFGFGLRFGFVWFRSSFSVGVRLVLYGLVRF